MTALVAQFAVCAKPDILAGASEGRIVAKHILIVGAGQAGFQTALSLRQGGWRGALTLIGDEPHAPYQRPPLSKTYLAGELGQERLFFRPPPFYAEQTIDLITDAPVDAVQPDAKEVQLADGRRIAYDALVLATGSQPRQIETGAPLHGLHRLADSDKLRTRLGKKHRWAIIGGGYIGLEAAATAVKAGVSVQVLEAAPRLLARVTAPPLSEFFFAQHRAAGVELRCDAAVEEVAASASKTASTDTHTVRLADGSRLKADTVLLAIGIRPNTSLAEAAGLEVEDGIVIDAAGRTSAPHIYACGDCTRQHHPLYERRVRLESVQNAIAQAKLVAASLLGQTPRPPPVPWFWSDQYQLKLQIAGLSQGYTQCVPRGRADSGSFALFYFHGPRLIACDAVNRPAEFMMSQRLIAARAAPDPRQLADESSAPKSWL